MTAIVPLRRARPLPDRGRDDWFGATVEDAFEMGRLAGRIDAGPPHPVPAIPVRLIGDRVAVAMARIRGIAGPPAPATGIAAGIAVSLSESIRDAVSSAVPYGRGVTIEADVAHQEADGSRTAGRVRIEVRGRD